VSCCWKISCPFIEGCHEFADKCQNFGNREQQQKVFLFMLKGKNKIRKKDKQGKYFRVQYNIPGKRVKSNLNI